MNLITLASLALFTSAMLSPSEKPYETETVVYSHPDGRNLKATLYTPAQESGELHPAIVLIHGGAWATGNRRQVFWYGRHFAENGYVAMSVNYRTMPGAPFPAPVHDVKSAVRWLRAHAQELHVDPNRIATLGTSAGGHLALMLALTTGVKDLEGDQNPGYPSNVEAAVSLYGPADLADFAHEKTTESKVAKYIWEPYLSSFVGKHKVAGREPLKAASPIDYVSPEAPPILLIHGTSDKLVPVEQSESIYEKLKKAGVPAEYIEAPGYGHAFDYLHPSVRREIFPKILAFLNEHLNGAGTKKAEAVRGNADAAPR